MHRFLSNNRHAKHIQHYVLHCSIGDWFVLYQMNKQMNKRFFSEFLALVSIKVNPDPYLRADPEVDIMKTEEDNLPNGAAFYDEDALGKRRHVRSIFSEEGKQKDFIDRQIKLEWLA